MKTSLTQEAEAELLGAIIFYNEKSEDLGKDFNKEFEAGVQDIEAFPEFWGNVGRGFRRKLLNRFPYGLIYEVREENILILAVMHTSRKPEYWRKDSAK
jgi:plasmid stabilization system protein ParE